MGTIKKNIRISVKESIGLCESKSYKSWFYEGCLKLSDRRKQAKLRWLQDTNEVNEDNVSSEGEQLIDISGTTQEIVGRTFMPTFPT
jgi:hypothetical protein